MKILIEDIYFNEKYVTEEYESVEEAWFDVKNTVAMRADNFASHEVEEDWELYYATYEEALKATYDGIYEQLLSEQRVTEIK